jgi:two-component system response regulator
VSENAAILLVEDDCNEVDVTLRAIRQSGVEAPVAVARDGQAALEALGLEPQSGAATPLRPRVVFLDLKLPRVDGWEVLRRLREHPDTADLPVVVISSSDEREDIRRSYELGANSFVRKRFDRRSPGRYLAEAAHYWLEVNHPPVLRRTNS